MSKNDSVVKNSVMKKSINFMSQRFVAMAFSGVLLIASVISLGINGLQFGLDFTGGLQIEAQFDKAVDLQFVRDTLSKKGLQDAVVVNFGSEKDLKITTQQNREELIQVQIADLLGGLSLTDINVIPITPKADKRLPSGGVVIELTTNDGSLVDKANQQFKRIGFEKYIVTSLENGKFAIVSENGVQVFAENLLIDNLKGISGGSVTIKRTEFVGPQVGDELRDKGGIGMLFALAVVMLYVAFRFQFKFSLAAVAALAHDVIIVVGCFSLFHWDFDLTVLAAVLAVIGYSLNDTIVVSDRIRENFRKIRKDNSVEIINTSLTQTLGRTLVTSLTTMLVLLALFFVGGELIHTFSIALIIGICVGTYSSIYVAANILLVMDVTREDLMVPVKEGAEMDDGMP